MNASDTFTEFLDRVDPPLLAIHCNTGKYIPNFFACTYWLKLPARFSTLHSLHCLGLNNGFNLVLESS
jgi:hypothetical protein